MSRRIELQPHLSTHELYERYCACRKPNKKARWRALYLISRGTLAAAAARRVGRTSGWVTQLTQRYNERGAEAVPDRRGDVRPGRRHASRAWPRNSTTPCALLRPTAGCGRRRRSRLGSTTAWRAMRRLGFSLQVPRTRHARAASEREQARFKKS